MRFLIKSPPWRLESKQILPKLGFLLLLELLCVLLVFKLFISFYTYELLWQKVSEYCFYIIFSGNYSTIIFGALVCIFTVRHNNVSMFLF